MVNLTIRLSKGSGGAGGAGADGSSGLGVAESLLPGGLLDPIVTVSCPDHLVLADLPVAKALGTVSDVTLVKVLGRKARRRLGDKVHFCVRCDFPIAIYGRLDPCEHIFCLTCARKDSACYLCGERVLRIQRLEVLDGIFICGAPRCLRSFIKRQDFQLHVKEAHADLIETTDDREKMQQEVDFQKGAASSEQQFQAQALSRSSSGVQLSLQEQKSGTPQLQTSESKGTQQKVTTPPSTVDEKHARKPEFEYQKQQQGHVDRPRRQRHERQQMDEPHVEEQNVHSEMQQVHQPPQQQPLQHSILPAPQPGIPVFLPQAYPPPYPSMQQEGMGMQPMYPVYQMPPAGGHLLPSPPLPPPRPPSGAPPLPPPPKRSRSAHSGVESDAFAEKNSGVDCLQQRESVSSVLEKIVERARAKGPSLSTFLESAEYEASSVLQQVLNYQVPVEPKPNSPFSSWIERLELLAPVRQSKESELAVKNILQILNEKQDAQLQSIKTKLSVPDVVEVLRDIENPTTAFVFYKWVRRQPFYIPHESIYAAVIEQLIASTDSDAWDQLHVVINGMVRRKVFIDNLLFRRILKVLCVYGLKHPCSIPRTQRYVDWLLRMSKAGFVSWLSTCKVVMKRCNILGMYESTLSVFEGIPLNANPSTLTAAVFACKGLNNLDMAEAIVDRMKRKKVEPNAKCFNILVRLCADHGQADKAQMYSDQMKELGFLVDEKGE